jgi:sec-independent protein translocase protein TatA
MGPLGWQETVFIFLLALLIFGPKKLPELGRTLGKAMTEFRRASSELKATFDREMKTLERESESLKEVTSSYEHDLYNYDYSSYESGEHHDSYDSTATEHSIASASAPQGAESPSVATPDGAVAQTAVETASAVDQSNNSEAPKEQAPEADGTPAATGQQAIKS